ncbi:hypothetical protein QYE76_049938 [Lolium multiflorum]|uniref:Reverse transcriptase domain-containing protein n=1 Tax=Lolium multiflorum TaxID=4521 RepID=A0AAD8WGS5_LOLMU|nr:hypothetical protein QYE76_049938 [Lolium multiflorum]
MRVRQGRTNPGAPTAEPPTLLLVTPELGAPAIRTRLLAVVAGCGVGGGCNQCGFVCIAMDEVRKKLFSISLSGKAAHWYKLLKNRDSLDWEDIVPLFYSKFYPPSEIHKDRNRIYNFWPHDGESIAQAWGRLKSLMLKCPIHELPGNVIIDNFYARLSFQDKTLLDTSCSGSFTRNKEEFKRDLLDRIQENTEGWENDKDRESEIEEERLLEILKKHRGAIGYTLDDLKGISPSICQHAINMEDDAKPVVEHQRRLIPKMKEVVRNEVLKLLEAGIIYPIADSRWVSPVHCVPKKGGMTVVPNDNDELVPQRVVVGYRMCIDFRKVNKVTKKDHYPLPFIDQMLERLSKNTHFCFLDGYSGFSQIAVKTKDQEKTTFTCPYETYAYRRMPFGLCNAPATFQRCMSAIFHGFCEIIVEVFMDDFSVYGNSFDNCLRNLDKVLQRCEETNLVLNWEKCHFMVNEGIVLGHKISERGIEVDRAKVEAIEKMPYPRDVKDFSKISKPLTNLLQKDVPFVFDDDCKEAFETLKKALTTASVVEPPDWNLPFEIMCDASDFAVGAVLGQRVSSRESPWSTMVSNNKDKGPLEEDIQDPELKEEVASEDEEEVEEVPRVHQRATIASIGVISNPSNTKRSARIATGGAVPRRFLAPRTSSPGNYHPFRNLIYNRQTERTPKVVLPSGWDIDRSNIAGEMKSEAEGWGNNSRSWDSPPDMIMSRVEHNSS